MVGKGVTTIRNFLEVKMVEPMNNKNQNQTPTCAARKAVLFSFSRKAHMGISEINNSVTRKTSLNLDPTWLDPKRRQVL
jgi:hypothetical protein